MSICRNRMVRIPRWWSQVPPRNQDARTAGRSPGTGGPALPRPLAYEPLRASDYFSGYQTVSSEAVTFTPAVTKQVSAFLLSRSPALSPDSKSFSSLSAV